MLNAAHFTTGADIMVDKFEALSKALESHATEFQLQAQRESFANADKGFVSGIVNSAIDAWQNPVKTGAKVGTGLALGAAIQAGLNNTEMMGGKIGTAAKVAKIALVAGTGLVAAADVVTSDKPGEALGHMAFDSGLFLGAAKLGTFADRVPGGSQLLGPRATSEVPKGLKFDVRGEQARVDAKMLEYGAYQVRLANGKGFAFHSSGDTVVPLREMPLSLAGKGHIEYAPRTTTLTTESGQKFVRDNEFGSISTKIGDDTLSTTGGKAFHMERRVDGRFESVSWNADGSAHVRRGNYSSGQDWSFAADGSVSMRSLPHGKYRMNFGPNGEGISSTAHGTSRGIAGMVGPRSRYAPLKRTDTEVQLKDVNAPSVVLPTAESRNALVDAKRILDDLSGGAERRGYRQ